MKPFLSTVATQLIATYGNDLSRVAVVFPNKRASLFLNEYLAREAGRPVWSPSYTTISDLFRSQSTLEVADPIKLVCDLHKCFTQCTGIDETLDHFYGWGQILLSDFDDIDKHLAPADKVFANLRDIREFDDTSYLTEEQRAMIRKFFSNFKEDHNSELKQRFLSLWSHIADIYNAFNQRLEAQNLAYEGALYRQVALDENLTFEYDYYVFVGFNLLQPVEQRLIDKLKMEGKAEVIWNKREEQDKEVTFIAAPTENIQARYVSTWLQEKKRIEAGHKTAIVLADEHLLQAVIHALPDEVGKVNVTTGYPLSQTPVATDIQQQINHEVNHRRQDAPIDNATLLQTLIEAVKSSALALRESDTTEDKSLEQEACFRMYTLLNRMLDLIKSGDLTVDIITLQRLTSQLIASTTIPFHGEPIEGIQVMGVLETRNLDFDHVLLLSCNEGNLPKGINDTSFIPYSIRKAFGLTTIDYKVSIYEQYFIHLLQRACDVTLVYNNATTDGKTGEMSRFMLQMMVESPHPITYRSLQAGQRPLLRIPKPIEKNEKVMEILNNTELLSPSAIARYLRCPLMFYYYYIGGLKELDDVEEDVIDNRLFGNIFHLAAQNIYKPMEGREVTHSFIDDLLKSQTSIIRAVDEAIKHELFHIDNPMAPMPPLNGIQLINREVIIRYVRQLLEVDRRLTPFKILWVEEKIVMNIPTGTSTLLIGGFADRIDQITLPDGTRRTRIIDYKTGSSRLKPLPDIQAIFDPANIRNHSDYYLQAFLYAHILRQKTENGNTPVAPCLLFIQHAGIDNYDPTLILGKEPITDIKEVSAEYMERINTLVAEMFSPAHPFIPTEDRTRCRMCPYSHICG